MFRVWPGFSRVTILPSRRCPCQTGHVPKWPWRTLGGLCGAVACASLADLCTGRFGARASPTTVVLASSTCSQDDQLLVIERPGATYVNCDLLSAIRADVHVLDARLAEIRSAHVSGASGPDAQE